MDLALDLMQHTGFAYFDNGKPLESGILGLGCGKGSRRTPCPWCGGPESRQVFDKTLRLEYGRLFDRHPVERVAYEKVMRHNGVYAAHIYGACQTVLLAECQIRGITVMPVHVGSWKSKIGCRGGGKFGYIDRVNKLANLNLTIDNEDQAVALGIGLGYFSDAAS